MLSQKHNVIDLDFYRNFRVVIPLSLEEISYLMEARGYLTAHHQMAANQGREED